MAQGQFVVLRIRSNGTRCRRNQNTSGRRCRRPHADDANVRTVSSFNSSTLATLPQFIPSYSSTSEIGVGVAGTGMVGTKAGLAMRCDASLMGIAASEVRSDRLMAGRRLIYFSLS